jgi:hypothetical protein
MPTSDSGREHDVLHCVLNGTSAEVVINGLTTTEKVQEIGIGANRSLRYLWIDASLWQLFGDEHDLNFSNYTAGAGAGGAGAFATNSSAPTLEGFGDQTTLQLSPDFVTL